MSSGWPDTHSALVDCGIKRGQVIASWSKGPNSKLLYGVGGEGRAGVEQWYLIHPILAELYH